MFARMLLRRAARPLLATCVTGAAAAGTAATLYALGHSKNSLGKRPPPHVSLHTACRDGGKEWKHGGTNRPGQAVSVQASSSSSFFFFF